MQSNIFLLELACLYLTSRPTRSVYVLRGEIPKWKYMAIVCLGVPLGL